MRAGRLIVNSNIEYTVNLTIPEDGALKASRCNCTFCQKPGIVNFSLQNPDDFKLLSPSTREELGDYNPNAQQPAAHKYFCKTCGVHVWAGGAYEFQGTSYSFFTVNLATIAQPQEGIDLSKVVIEYVDGLHDRQSAGKRGTPWEGGLL